MTTTRNRNIAIGAGAAAAAGLGIGLGLALTAGPSPVPVVCNGTTSTDTASLTNAIKSAETNAAAVEVGAGICSVSGMLHITAPMTLSGNGPATTHLVEASPSTVLLRSDAANVTVENLDLNDTITVTKPPSVNMDNDPAVFLAAASSQTASNLHIEGGGGFGIRFLGPNYRNLGQPPLPCTADQSTGDSMINLSVTTIGLGGYAAVDYDCQNGGSLTNITIHGGILALYQDENVTVNGEKFHHGSYAGECQTGWIASGPQKNITVENAVMYTGSGGILNENAPAFVPIRANTAASMSYQQSANIMASQQVVDPKCPPH